MGFTYLFGNMFGWHLSAGLVIWRSVEYLLPVVIAAPCMGMRSTTGESIYHRWDRRLENTVHVAHGDWGSVKRRAGITYRPTASQPSSPERKVTRSQTGDLTVKMPQKASPRRIDASQQRGDTITPTIPGIRRLEIASIHTRNTSTFGLFTKREHFTRNFTY